MVNGIPPVSKRDSSLGAGFHVLSDGNRFPFDGILYPKTVPDRWDVTFHLSATYDQGKEFSDLETFSKHFKIDNYVCRAYKSQDKGAIENGNGQIRRFFPSSSDLSLVTQEKLDSALRWINITPMTVLKNQCPNDVWFLACKHRTDAALRSSLSHTREKNLIQKFLSRRQT